MTPSWRHHFPRSRKSGRDFHRPRYGNPLFSSAAKAVRPSGGSSRGPRRGGNAEAPWWRRPAVALPLAAALGIVWYAFWGSAFRITTIEFNGATPSTEETLRASLDEYLSASSLLVFPHANVVLFSESGAVEAIGNDVYLDSIDIRKKLPGTIIVDVTEKPMRLVAEHAGRLFAVDDDGYVLRELTGEERSKMPDLPPGLSAVAVPGLGAETVDLAEPGAAGAQGSDAAAPAAGTAAGSAPETAPNEPPPKNEWPLLLDRDTSRDTKKKPVEPGRQVFTPDVVSTALQAASRLPDVTGETVRWFVPDTSSDSIEAVMASGWHALLATTSPFDVQSDRLSIVLKEKIGTKRDQLEYVDLRYNERIYFRLKGQQQ